MAFSYKTVHLSENPCYTLDRSGLIENPYIPAIRTRFVQPGKIEIDANERAAIGKRNAAFSFAPSSILSLTNYRPDSFFHMTAYHTKKSSTRCTARSPVPFPSVTMTNRSFVKSFKSTSKKASGRTLLPLPAESFIKK